MWICRYFVYFVIFSFMGWIYESAFCTIKGGKWENRGFLYGPIVPIYGVGAAALVGVGELIHTYIGSYTWWQIFLIGYLGSIVLEYSTSWALEMLFHAYWWDYSDMPFNIKGRICLPFSLCFGGAAILVTYVIAPFTLNITNKIPAIGMELLALVFMAIVAADTTLTVSALTNFERSIIAAEAALNTHMEAFVTTVQEKTQAAGSLVQEKTQAAGNLVQEKTQAASNLIMEEKERFSKEKLEQTLSSMGGVYHSAVRRVKGFKYPKLEKNAMEKMVDAIKKHVPKRKPRN